MKKNFLLAASFLLALAAAPLQAQEITLKLNSSDPAESHTVLLGKLLADGVAERTGGKLKIEVYPDHTLAGGSFKTEVELTRSGVIDISNISTIISALFTDSRFDVFSLPFGVSDHDIFGKIVEGTMGDKIREWSKENGFTVLGIGINGFRQLTNNVRPIGSVEDMKGIKFRVPGTELFLSAFKNMEADAVTMDWAELYQALAQGVVDGQENPFQTVWDAKFFEVQKYVTHWNYIVDPYYMQMSTKKFESLPEEYQEILLEEGAKAAVKQRAYSKEQDLKMKELLKTKGMVVTEPTPEAMAEFKARLLPLYEQFEEAIGKENIDLMASEIEKAKG
jgi:tripartite ATP-independent transporter DctP family solute receptor